MTGEDDDAAAEAGAGDGRLRGRLRRSAFAYLERYSASEARFRAVMVRKLRRWREAGEADVEEGEAARLIEALAGDFRRLGLIDDGLYAESKVASARRKGQSRAGIAGLLRARGVNAETAAAAIEAAGIDELTAALRLARRRRLGPWRRGEDADREGETREIATLVRRGFEYALARQVVRMPLAEAEERLYAGEPPREDA